VIDASAIAKEMSAKKVARKHIAASFDKKTVEAKLKAKFDNGKKYPTVSVTLRIVKDEVIWLKATKFITVLKAKITPISVQFYSPLEKKYFDGDFSSLEKLLGTEINFEQLQNLLLGQAIQNVKKEKQLVEIQNNAYVLSPKVQANLFDIFFAVNPSHFKLDRQSIVNSIKEQRLDILYPNYKIIEDEVFPAKISIRAKQKKKYTNIDLTFKTVKFNTDVNTSFKIPSNYKRINL
jgi:hypothetical protein